MNDRSRGNSDTDSEVRQTPRRFPRRGGPCGARLCTRGLGLVARENSQDFVANKLIDVSAAALDDFGLFFEDAVQDIHDLFWPVTLRVGSETTNVREKEGTRDALRLLPCRYGPDRASGDILGEFESLVKPSHHRVDRSSEDADLIVAPDFDSAFENSPRSLECRPCLLIELASGRPVAGRRR